MNITRIIGISADDQEVEARFHVVDTPDRSEILKRVRELMGDGGDGSLLRELETPEPLLGIDGVDTWSAQAAELVRDDRSGSTLRYEANGGEEPRITWLQEGKEMAQAYHCPQVLIIDVTGLARLEISADDYAHP